MDIKTIVQEPLDCAAEVFNMTADIAISLKEKIIRNEN